MMEMNKKKLVNRLVLAMLSLFMIQVASAESKVTSEDDLARKVALYKSEKDLYADALVRFMGLLQKPSTLPVSELQDIPYQVRNIALYRTGDRQNKLFSKSFYNSLEQQIVNKLTMVKRFAVKECFECKVTKVLLRKDQFMVMRQIDSTEGMKNIGKKIEADSFMLWDAFLYKGQPIIDMRLFVVESGAVVWSKQYKSELTVKSEDEMYIGLWEVPATRLKSVIGTADAISSNLMVIGRRITDQSTISPRVQFGFGWEFMWNPDERPGVSVWGLGVNGVVSYDIDHWFGEEAGNYGNYVLYGSLGQVFNFDDASTSYRGGLRIRFSKQYYIELGFAGISELLVKQESDTAYAGNALLSGNGLDFTLGVRF